MAVDDNFLARWSRRKQQTRREGEPRERAPEKPAVAPPAPAAAAARPPAAPELPPVDSLRGLASEYKDFLNPAVDDDLRRSALKQLFHDPHFNVMDGLDVYIDDYSKPDPMPESMLKELLARHRTFTEQPEPEAEAEDRGDAPVAAPQALPASEPEPPAAATHEPAAPAAEEKKST
jgi:uncharacterized protein DUF3306